MDFFLKEMEATLGAVVLKVIPDITLLDLALNDYSFLTGRKKETQDEAIFSGCFAELAGSWLPVPERRYHQVKSSLPAFLSVFHLLPFPNSPSWTNSGGSKPNIFTLLRNKENLKYLI